VSDDEFKRPELPFMPDHPGVREGLQEVLDGEYRIDVLDIAKLGRPPVLIDAGANIGAFTKWAQFEYPGCTVHAYEPHPINIGWYRKNCPDVDLVEAAIVNCQRADGEMVPLDDVPLFDGADSDTGMSGMASLECTGGQRPDKTFRVRTVSAADLPPCDLLKIDTEGSEIPILQGYKHLDGVIAVMLEWHEWSDQFYIGAFLASRGFRCVEQRIREPLETMGERFWGHYGTLKFVRPAFLTECTACRPGPGLRRGFLRADGLRACRECLDVWKPNLVAASPLDPAKGDGHVMIYKTNFGEARMYWAHDRVLVGGLLTHESLAKIKQLGVTHVITADEHNDAVWWPRDRLCALPFYDDGEPIERRSNPPDLGKGIEFAERVLSESGTILYCHCRMGGSRGPAMGYMALRAGLKMSKPEALACVLRTRGDWNPHANYIASIERALEKL